MHYDAQKLVVEIYLALERAEARPSIDRARAVARAAGAKFTNAQSVAWLEPFRQSAEKRREPRQTFGGENKHETAELRREPRRENGLTRDKVIPSIPSSASLRSALPASAPQAGQDQKPAEKPRPPKPLKLGLDDELHVAARAILAAVWAELGATAYSATITKTEWGRRNARVAADLARSGVSPERCVEGWRAATERLGAPVRMLAVVQDELGRMALSAPKLRVVDSAEPAWLIQARQRGLEDERQRRAAREAAMAQRGIA